MIAPDEITYKYMKGREFMPKGKDFEKAKNIGKPYQATQESNMIEWKNFKLKMSSPWLPTELILEWEFQFQERFQRLNSCLM